MKLEIRDNGLLHCITWLTILVSLPLLNSCKSDKPEDINEPQIVVNSKSVYICNEGNFQFGNASISYYNPSQNECSEDIFKSNNNSNLGDVCQSMTFFNGKAYIVVNNSHKIEVVNLSTFQRIATINGFNSPRYFLPINNSKAYVTDLYENRIAILDLNTNSISNYIPCNGWTEKLKMMYGKVFITNQRSDKLYVINAINDQITDSIPLKEGGNSVIEDKTGKLWVLCGGNRVSSIPGGLYRINPSTNEVEQSFPFTSSNTTPWRLTVNATNDTLYWLNNGVYRMAINDSSLPTAPFIDQSGSNFYGLGIDPSTNEIYISDAIDYVQKGVIYRYQSNGNLINTFRAGIIPGEFYFR